MKKAVILNDTRADYHHGCSRVMTVLDQGLKSHGIEVTAYSPLRHRWWSDRNFLARMADADLVVINGEGTLHHGRPAGSDLLKVVEHETCPASVYLVNALYQDNPEDWKRYLSAFAGVWVRDSRSADELRKIGIECHGVLPDLTVCGGALVSPSVERSGLIVGDSVDADVAAALRKFAAESGAPFVPSLSHLKRPKGRTSVTRFLRNCYIDRFEQRARRDFPLLNVSKSVEAYAANISGAELHVTGRFHGVCFSILTMTPFVALKSNSWKVEALLDDLGLSKSRLVSLDTLEKPLVAADWAFTGQELENIKQALDQSQLQASRMFETIAQGPTRGR